MADNKKSFILYCDLIHTIEKLPDEKAGMLFKHLLRYVNDKDPVTDDILVEISFEPIKQQLKRDLKEWSILKENRSESGTIGNLKRWNKDVYDDFVSGKITIQQAKEIAKHRKASQPDSTQSQSIANIAVNGTVTVNETNIKNNDLKVDWDSLKNIFIKITGKNILKITDKTRKQIIARLRDGYSREQIVKAIENCYKDDYHKETNHKHLTLEFISRPDKMEKYATVKPNTSSIKRTGEKL